MIHFLQMLVIFLATISTASVWAPGGMALNVLVGYDLENMEVKVMQYLNASTFYLVMQPDCNLILYNGSDPVLSTNTSCDPLSLRANTTLTMETSGRMSIDEVFGDASQGVTSRSTTVWSPYREDGKTGSSYPYMILRGNGSYDFYDFNNKQLRGNYGPLLTPYTPQILTAPAPAPGTANSTGGSSGIANIAYPFPPELEWKPQISLDGYPYMPAEYFLAESAKLQTLDQRFVLMLGFDCGLRCVDILMNKNIWESGTNNSETSNCQVILQQDGRLEIRNNVSGAVYWNSNATGSVSVNWVLKLGPDDGVVSISDIENSSNVLWSNTDLNQAKSMSNRPKSSTVWIVVGVVVGASVLAMAGFALLYYYARAGNILDPAEKAFRRRLEDNGGKSLPRFSQAKIKNATSNFGNKIGSGGFGDVFHGKLADGQEIAAKVLSEGSHQSKQEFYNEIELLSVVHHKYLVSLLGYGCNQKQQVLIYEFMSGGDLRHRLQGKSAAENPLSWRQRTGIALQVAEGLEYLHDKCSPSIIHRDVKSTNILLTDKLVAKVADFGLSKLRSRDQDGATHVTTIVKGTPGYLDPEYHESGMLTDKSDVYAFGIMLMEILTGQNQMYIATRVAEAWRLEEINNLPDPNLRGEFHKDEFVSMVELSLWCVRKSSGERPFMRQVVQRLRDLGLAPLEPLQLEISLGEEDQQVMAFGTDSVIKWRELTSDTSLPFHESSSSGMSSKIWHEFWHAFSDGQPCKR